MDLNRAPGHLDIDVPGMDEVFVGGRWQRASCGGQRGVVMPSTELLIATVASPSTADADLAVRVARDAFDTGPWPRMTIEERVAVCKVFCDELEARMGELNRAWIFESGTTTTYADVINSRAAIKVWRNALRIAPEIQLRERRSGSDRDVMIARDPVGPVLAILSYNGPVVLLGMKVIPALLAGCPVIVKHAPESALTSRLIAECARVAGFPLGVLSVLAGDIDVGQYLVAHPGIDLITVTAGTGVGMRVAQVAAGRLVRTVLELGGKSPAIILDTADLDSAMSTLISGAIGNAGQRCVSLSRILVSRTRYDEVVDRLAREYGSIRVGDPFDPMTDHGPLAVPRALHRTERYVRQAVSDGARVVIGGRRPSQFARGWFYEPTLVADVDNAMAVARDEIFGPVTAVLAYDGVDDAIRIANDSVFGLAASVYAADDETALAVAVQLRAGSVGINTAANCLTEPTGGVKQSGWGRENGAEGLAEFLQSKQICFRGSYLDTK